MTENYTVQVRIAGQNNLSAPVGQAQQSLRGLNQEAQRSNQAFTQMRTVMAGALAGVTIAGVTRLAEDLFKTGMEAQRAGNLFRSFGAQVGDTSALLERLRKTTRGVVDDTALMNAANSQLSMGLAKSADDVNRLMNIGVTFAQAMGTDVTSSLENLNMIIANQSFLRLDSLGISSSQVRALADRYKAAGMDSSEAFTAAFLEVAEGKLPQMAAVADATVTEFQKMQVAMDNWWSDFGERFAQGVNGLIGIATHAGPIINRALFGQDMAWADNTAQTAPGVMGAALEAITQRNPYGTGAAYDAQMGGQAERVARLMGYSLNNPGVDLFSLETERVRQITGLFSLAEDRARLYVEAAVSALDAMQDASRQVEAEARAAEANLHRRQALLGGGYGSMPGNMVNLAGAQQSPADRRRGANGYRDWLMNMTGQFYGIGQSAFAGGRERSGITLFNEDDVRRAEMAANRVQDMVDAAERWNQLTGRSMISDSDLQAMQQMAAEARGFADEVTRGQQALDNMSLPQLFGQTSGGQAGEFDRALLAQLQAGGMSSEGMEAWETMLGLNSGAVTGMSAQFDAALSMAADIGNDLGYDAAIAFRTAYLEAVREAASDNYTGTLPLDLIAVSAGLTQTGGSAGPAGSYTVQPGDTLSAIAAQRGMTVAQLAAANNISNPGMIMAGQTLNFGGGGEWAWDGTALAQSMDEAEQSTVDIGDGLAAAADTFATRMDEAFAQIYRVSMQLDVTEINVTPTFRSALAQIVAELVRANGGSTPGSSSTVGRSQPTRD